MKNILILDIPRDKFVEFINILSNEYHNSYNYDEKILKLNPKIMLFSLRIENDRMRGYSTKSQYANNNSYTKYEHKTYKVYIRTFKMKRLL